MALSLGILCAASGRLECARMPRSQSIKDITYYVFMHWPICQNYSAEWRRPHLSVPTSARNVSAVALSVTLKAIIIVRT
jgi:hypothetical protein